MEYTLPSDMTSLEALRQIYPDSSRRTLQNWLKGGRFFLNGKRLKSESILLREGEVLSSVETFRPQTTRGLKILYEDRYLIAIDKPVGLLSVPLDGTSSGRHALGLLHRQYDTEQIFAVHRIDRETSGVLMFARGKDSENRLKELFEKHDLKRQYFAIVEGRMQESEGMWQSRLKELPSYDVVPSDEEGKDATTHFSVLHRSSKYSYVNLTLETGRKHQIRVHCQMAGHPVVGDARYGSVENPLRRLCLHSSLLAFRHPFTEKEVSFSSPLPGAFKVLGGQLHSA